MMLYSRREVGHTFALSLTQMCLDVVSAVFVKTLTPLLYHACLLTPVADYLSRDILSAVLERTSQCENSTSLCPHSLAISLHSF